jgi:hypothetical protein
MRFLTLLFLLVQSLSFSQTESKNSFGFYVQPDLTGVFARKYPSAGKDIVKKKLGFSVGFNFNRKLSEKVVFRTGIGYGFKNCVSNQTGLIFGSDIDPQQGYISESRIEGKIHFHEVHIPISFQFKIYDNFHINVGLELSKAFADNSTRTIYYGNGDVEKMESNNVLLFNGAPLLSVLYQFPLKNQAFVSIEPYGKLYARPYLFNDVGMYNFGLRLNYGFSKNEK